MKDRFNNAVGPQVRAGQARPGKVVPLLALVALLAGVQAATQFLAHDLQYHPSLGAHWRQLYPPWGIVLWAAQWYGHYPDVFLRAASAGILLAGGALVALAVMRMLQANSARPSAYLHGSARWADARDIRRAGLMPGARRWSERLRGLPGGSGEGVYVGAWVDARGAMHYLRHNGPEHVLTYAPTRSGKGVGLVVPTLLSWPHSTVVTDLKGELWAMTAGWRQKHAHNKVIRFEPASPDAGLCWNPLDEIRIATEYEVGDVQNLATLIVDPDGRGLESHWQKTSQALLVGVILHVLYKARADGTPATLPAVDAMLADPTRDTRALWQEMTSYPHCAGKAHPAVASAGRDMLDRPDEEGGSVLSTAKSYLALYRDPVVARNVSHSQFRIKDLMHHRSPVSLYIVTQPSDKARLRPLVRVMVNMIVRLLADKMEFERVEVAAPGRWWRIGRAPATAMVRARQAYQHRLLGLLDEFPSLGRLEILQESLAFVASYGIKFYLICQDVNQLKSKESGYGPDETITSNCHIQNAYPPNRIETAEHLSKLTGQTTVAKEQITTSGRRTSAILGQVSRTTQETQRPLLTPDECLRMPGPKKDAQGQITEAGDMVVYVAGFPAIYGRQPLFFQDPTFAARAAVPEPAASDVLRPVRALAAGEEVAL
ncbi:type IV secretory system conjugative DNA transfer family protein [Comamonas endophytica]|uniref:Type IV secretory system conjugative DNA transfer family protein n=1 Tax=Comamonas endophytica TaxID=2949090 RepID=A0ABY6GFQ4_9BURK|nr:MULTISPECIES: type IV secretory system conjugative DNA transfer family protein [unclassified Acidovorax]MCD2513321.1 type IV secretory system conjugative DNA transfer family protein [Acidovorax sp. D4N7]UYG53922.1 type IV secretory system conjugative DNA transfer family protein [Acidovorax sp. 5MLIR]